MALIKCPECGKEISDQAVSCPNCGYPINHYVNEVVVTDDMSISNKNNKADIQNNIGSKKNNVPLILFFIISGILLIRMISVLVVSSSEYKEIDGYYTSSTIELIDAYENSDYSVQVLKNTSDVWYRYSQGGIPEAEKGLRSINRPYIAIYVRVGLYIVFVLLFLATIIEVFGRKKWELSTFVIAHATYLIIALVDVGTTIFIHLVIKNKSVLYGELARLTDLDGFSDTSTATVIGMIIGIIFILLFVAIYKITASNIDEIK